MDERVERSAREDLAMNRRLMEQSRRSVEQVAPHFVVWGLLMTAALLVTFANTMGALHVDELWIWVGAVGAGWVASLAIGAGAARRGPGKGPGARIMAILAAVDDAEFTDLREQVNTTDGNLATHLRKLEDAGYVKADKSFRDRKPVTRYRMTEEGRAAFRG